jgi:hypothetical protein
VAFKRLFTTSARCLDSTSDRSEESKRGELARNRRRAVAPWHRRDCREEPVVIITFSENNPRGAVSSSTTPLAT